jgi:amino acid transporter
MSIPLAKGVERETKPHLERQLDLLGATSLNMSDMVGSGLFVALPLMIGAMGGPQAMIGWFVGGLIAISDGLVWSELGAALPGSGGSYIYLRESFGSMSWGRLGAFLFSFQLVCSGPLEIASASIAIGQYVGYLWRGMTALDVKLVAAGVAALGTALLYTRLRSIAKLVLGLWAGVLVTVGWIIFAGLTHFNPAVAFSFPPGAFVLNKHFFVGLGVTTNYVMYCYLGYYAICYVGDEVVHPGRTVPRSVILSIVAVVVLDFLFCFSILGVIPWQEAMQSQFVAADFMHKVYGRWAGVLVCLLMIWVSFGGIYAMILTYSRTPYAAALDGNFFRVFARIHPKKHIPHVSLLLIGGLSVIGSFLSLDEVIKALMTARILSQFLIQIIALDCLRKYHPEVHRPFKMILYPLPSAIAFIGWIFIFVSAGPRYIIFGLLTLLLGCTGFLCISRKRRSWPFAIPQVSSADPG